MHVITKLASMFSTTTNTAVKLHRIEKVEIAFLYYTIRRLFVNNNGRECVSHETTTTLFYTHSQLVCFNPFLISCKIVSRLSCFCACRNISFGFSFNPND